MEYSESETLSQIFTGIPSTSLWIFFGIFVGLVIIVSLVLIYHFNKYRLYSPALDKMQVIYIVGTIVLLLLSAGALLFHIF